MPLEVPSELARFTDVEPSRGKIVPSWAQSVGTISVSARNRGGKKMVPTGFEPVTARGNTRENPQGDCQEPPSGATNCARRAQLRKRRAR